MLLNCGHESTAGYGEDRDGKTICYACCADIDRKAMDETGRAAMYFTHDCGGREIQPGCWDCHGRNNAEVTNWPGSLRYRVMAYRVGGHNIAGRRYDVWFRDHVGKEWHGVQYGDRTQLCHCRRMK